MQYTDNPIADFSAYDDECEEALKKLPVCVECGEPISDDEYYVIADKIICPTCLVDNHRRWTDDYINY